jgi:lipopolysaccharide export LptBFGC system permease protein LptF
MNQETKNNIREFIVNNFSKIITILLLLHIFIGFSFLLYNNLNPKCDNFKYEIIDGDKKYNTNEVYLGDSFFLFFNGDMGTYESSDEVIKVYSDYQIDTIDDKIKICILKNN